jgi:hypothetical protein
MTSNFDHSFAFRQEIPWGNPAPMKPIFAPLLTTAQLCEALSSLLHRKPCVRTIQRWVRCGMPHHVRPRTGRRGGKVQRWFLLDEVYPWLLGATISRDLTQEAVDLSHRRPVRNRAA